MNKSQRQQRERRKQALLQKIQQQRQSLSAYGQHWLTITRSYDHSWQIILSFKPYFAIGSGILLLYGIRHPRKLYRWSRRLVGFWTYINTLRNILNGR
ncbi:YqjK-like family protein [Xenorhabdus budapestensis]|uniref:Cell division protein FtsH n=1 Tax=Xenorhabdus budapestensis TaxID=290110 RepID=A0A2D0IZU8_XENBU|nr:YqjK-like family protein [Xenorhabdus budapestensis]PHM27464.1 cell division protein FtsH [Xenorhabdus budapestensis]